MTSMLLTARAMLFDLDGVLVDSTPVITRIWEKWAVEHGFEPEKTAREAHGRPSFESIRELLPDGDHEALNRDLEQREIDDTEGVVALPGIVELLASLPPERWAIVTSCSRALAEATNSRGGRTTGPAQTWLHPATSPTANRILSLTFCGAHMLGFSADDCIVVEDAPAGIRSGKAAGARVMALRTTAGDAELLAAGADWVIDDFKSLKANLDPETGLLRISID